MKHFLLLFTLLVVSVPVAAIVNGDFENSMWPSVQPNHTWQIIRSPQCYDGNYCLRGAYINSEKNRMNIFVDYSTVSEVNFKYKTPYENDTRHFDSLTVYMDRIPVGHLNTTKGKWMNGTIPIVPLGTRMNMVSIGCAREINPVTCIHSGTGCEPNPCLVWIDTITGK